MGTKTEDYLRILAEGGDAPVSCCMTNEQKLIAEAIDRINHLDPGGGGGGATIFYTTGVPLNGVPITLYKDEAMTQQATYNEFETASLSGPVYIKARYDYETYYMLSVTISDISIGNSVTFIFIGENYEVDYVWEHDQASPGAGVVDKLVVPVLYSTTGQNTDGAVTQKCFTDTVGNVETILTTLNSGNGAQ